MKSKEEKKIYNAKLFRKKSEYVAWTKMQKGYCERCGQKHPYWVLDYHHRDRKEKLFTIGKNPIKSKEEMDAEIAKCDLLCANCHREVEHDERSRSHQRVLSYVEKKENG